METVEQERPSLVMTNCQYNVTKQLEKKLQFLWNVAAYIEDAEKEGNVECAKLFREIRADEERHAKALKEILLSQGKDFE